MFIHWGVYSVPGRHLQGQADRRHRRVDHVPRQNSHGRVSEVREGVQSREIQRRQVGPIAKNAGMKYIVITSKHHDGFAMFDTKAPTGTSSRRPLSSRSAQGVGRRLPQARHQTRLLLLAGPGLEQRRARPRGGKWDPAQDGRHGRLHRQSRSAAGERTAHRLWRISRRALVGHGLRHESRTRRPSSTPC